MGCILEFLYEIFCEFLISGSYDLFRKHIKREWVCRLLTALVCLVLIAGLFGIAFLILRICGVK